MRRRDFLKAGLAAGVLAAVPSAPLADSRKADPGGPAGGPHGAAGPASAAGSGKYAFVDNHLHCLDVIRDTNGLEVLTRGEPSRADHPALRMVCDLAAETGLPMLIQHNIADSYEEPIYLAEMEQALRRHPNLYFDISWLVFEDYIARDETSLDLRARLLKRQANRFMGGTDVVGQWASYPPNISKHQTLLGRPSPGAAAAVARDNILELVKAVQQA